MSKLPNRKNLNTGQMLLSVLIAIGVFAILAHAIFTLVAGSFDLINFNRSRITARFLASKKIESIRNMNYFDIGTVGGIPDGLIVEEENTQLNGLNYKITTSVIYIDDIYDGTAPSDLDPEDYKRIRVEISWEGLAASRKNPIILITDINPDDNTESTEGGTLNILVFDSDGLPLPGADVHVVASSTNPTVDLTQQTGVNGGVSLPGAPPCVGCYEITVTKPGYSIDRTYSTSEVTNPIKPHTSIFSDQITQMSFAIDEVGTINISSFDSRANGFTTLGNVPFRLRGNKIIGTNSLGQPVYKNFSDEVTDGSGNFTLTNAEWDTYQILMPSSSTWNISGNNPLQPLSLLPGNTIGLSFTVESFTSHSLLAIIKDPSQNLIASVSARLIFPPSYDQTVVSGSDEDPDFGQAFFSGLTENTYTVEATASGYVNFSGTFDVSGYTTSEVVMTPE
jgi:hypothetical protein